MPTGRLAIQIRKSALTLPVFSDDDDLQKLVSDRVQFKLYAAKYHLDNIKKEIESSEPEGSDNASKDATIIRIEIEADCFLSQLVGAVDALLVEINDKLGLGTPIERLELNTIQSALNARTKNIDLLTELLHASSHNNWLWFLKELRVQAMSRTIVKRTSKYNSLTGETEVSFSLQQGKSVPSPGRLPDYVNEELIGYFEKSIQQVRDVVIAIRAKGFH